MAEACYTEPYLPASFKFVSFKAVEASSEHGRRGAEGEFPFGEGTAYADLGRKIRTYSIQARFDGNDHVLRAAALIAVCEAKGPGVLVHPTRGVIASAACRSLKVTDRVEEEQGVTTVDLVFVEANNWPNGLSLLGQLLGFALGAIIGPARAHFLSRYRPASVPSFRLGQVVGTAQAQVSNIAVEYAAATVSNGDDLNRNRTISDLTRLAEDDILAADPAVMDRGLALGLNAIALKLTGTEKFRAFRRLANGAAQGSSFGGVAGQAENATFAAVRAIAATYMAEGVMEQNTATSTDVFAQIDAIDALVQGEMAYARAACENDLFLALAQFRTDALAQLYGKAYDSPGVARFDFGGRVHPLVAAYSIFGDAKRHRDVEAMNVVSASGRIGPAVYSVPR
jgi:prophage DNA circulation protein